MSLIHDVDKTLGKFIQQNKKARIKIKYLQDKNENGGFALPNLVTYYQAFALTCGWKGKFHILFQFTLKKSFEQHMVKIKTLALFSNPWLGIPSRSYFKP